MNTERRSTFPKFTGLARRRRAWAVSAVLGFALTAMITIGGGSWRVRAATGRFVATTGSDASNDCSNPASPCKTITHAISQTADPDTIHVAAGTYFENVVFGLTHLTVQGAGAGATTVDGGSADSVFSFGGPGSLTLSDMTITNGNGNLGHFGSDSGGGVGSDGDVTIIRCNITGNKASQTPNSSGRGGGIFAAGNLTVMDSTITNNSADVRGGGIFVSSGTVNIGHCTIGGNTADFGGGIYEEQGTLSLTNSTISGNTAHFAGGIFNLNGTLSLTTSTISGNTGDFGGGINSGGTLTLTTSTISGNMAHNGGGIFVDDAVGVITNGTISGNSASFQGGGILNGAQALTIVNTTISANSAPPGSGGGIFLQPISALNLTNTIIAGSTGGDCVNQGTIASNSHNLIQDGSCSPMLTGDPKLGPLQNNGGLTSTRALLAGSPAIDAGDDSVTGSPLSLSTDQRGMGFARKSGPHVDIGAFEVQGGNGGNFDTCVKDTNTGNLFQFSSTTGAYSFTICGQPAVTGTGKIQVIGSTTYLNDFTTPGRKIQAYFNHGQLIGRANVTLSVAPGVYQTTVIYQTMPGNGSCACQ